MTEIRPRILKLVGRVEERRAHLSKEAVAVLGLFLRLSPSAGASLTLPHSHVSSPRPSNRTCGFPASGSHPGSCPSPTEGSSRTVPAGAARSPALVRGTHVSPAPSRRSRRSHRQGRPVVPDPTAPPGIASHRAATPFASACSAIRSLRAHNGAYRLLPVTTALSSFLRSSQTKAPSLRRSYPASPLLRAYPPPCRPKLALAGSRLARAPHRQGFPCCHCFPLTRMLPSLPRRNRPVLASLASRPLAAFPEFWAGRLPHYSFRGLLNVHCSLRPARSLSRPRRPFDIEVLQPMSLPP